MPWSVKKSDQCPVSEPWACVKDDDGEIEGCHASKSAAMKQQRALYASEAEKNAKALRDYRSTKFGKSDYP